MLCWLAVAHFKPRSKVLRMMNFSYGVNRRRSMLKVYLLWEMPSQVDEPKAMAMDATRENKRTGRILGVEMMLKGWKVQKASRQATKSTCERR